MIKKVWKWFIGKASIQKKLGISFTIITIFPMLIIGVFLFVGINQNIKHQVNETIQSSLSVLAADIESIIRKEEDNLKFLCYDVRFRKALEETSKHGYQLTQLMNENIEPILWYFQTSDQYIKSIEVYSPYIKQRSFGNFLFSDKDVRDENWYKEHTYNFRTLWTREGDKLYATRTILDANNSSRMIGVLRMELYADKIFSSLKTMNYLGGGILLKNNKGQIIFKNPSSSSEIDEVVSENLTKTRGKLDFPEKVYVYDKNIETTGWTMSFYIKSNAVLTQIYPLMKSVLAMLGGCLIIALAISNGLSKVLSKRLLELKISAERFAKGDFDEPHFTEDTDEFGVVANSFSTMIVKIQEMIDKLYKVEVEKKTAELQTLQAMINPHFLYNCLASLKWKALYHGQQDIAQEIGLLVQFYRTSMNGGRELTTVGDELENIRAYIQLQQRMYQDSFDVIYEIDDTHLEEEMLNFLLQPIVENAIIHGIDYCEEGERGRIIIRYFVDKGILYFEVLNNGGKLSQEKGEIITSQPTKGYGVYNICQRIKLFYGSLGEVSAYETPDAYTCFSIKLPIIKK